MKLHAENPEIMKYVRWTWIF